MRMCTNPDTEPGNRRDSFLNMSNGAPEIPPDNPTEVPPVQVPHAIPPDRPAETPSPPQETPQEPPIEVPPSPSERSVGNFHNRLIASSAIRPYVVVRTALAKETS